MYRWSDLDGRAAERLRGALAASRVAHAYLFCGALAAPQLRAARVLAAALNCQHPRRAQSDDPCGTCDACHKIEAGIHPDVITLPREGAAQLIPIETVRGVIARLALPPHEAAMRVFLVEEAAALAGASANALLKTLEEPPARTMFILCTVAPDGLLPTIRSRCQRVRMGAGASAPAAAGDGDDSEKARREHLDGLGRELALAEAPAGDLPARICEGKGDAPLVLEAALATLHSRMVREAAAGDAAGARRASARAMRLVDLHRAMTIHNAQPQLALDALLGAWSAP